MKPFTFSRQLSAEEKQFNYRLSTAHIVVENAFGRLKARWHCLLKQNDMAIANTTMVVTACCILHKVCEICISYTTALRCIWILGARGPRASASKIHIHRSAVV